MDWTSFDPQNQNMTQTSRRNLLFRSGGVPRQSATYQSVRVKPVIISDRCPLGVTKIARKFNGVCEQNSGLARLSRLMRVTGCL